ncbi:MAG: hypothetical protein HY913_08835 [Desulfomonile tiedjei]|nr:hypothetical protein [Desulfomonile tiedjei]
MNVSWTSGFVDPSRVGDSGLGQCFRSTGYTRGYHWYALSGLRIPSTPARLNGYLYLPNPACSGTVMR